MNDSNDSCPRCNSRRIVLGELTHGITIGPAGSFSFRAFAAQLSALRKGAKLSPNVAACSQCGLIWGQVAVGRLPEHLESFPTDDVAAWLKSSHNTPI